MMRLSLVLAQGNWEVGVVNDGCFLELKGYREIVWRKVRTVDGSIELKNIATNDVLVCSSSRMCRVYNITEIVKG